MASHWSSKLFVFKDEQGQDCVASALPTGIFEGSQVQAYQADGPYMPVGFPKPEVVGDASKWMADLTKKGFTFKPSTIA